MSAFLVLAGWICGELGWRVERKDGSVLKGLHFASSEEDSVESRSCCFPVRQ